MNPIIKSPLSGTNQNHYFHSLFSPFIYSSLISTLQKVNGNAGPKKATASAHTGKYYPADDVKTPLKSRKGKKNAPKIRASITPGTIVILLAGRFRGKRVVCLKSLESGLLLVSGPYKVNGVPLRRVSPAYVIATSTKVDVASVDVSAFNDAYFAREANSEKEDFFAGDAPKAAVVSDARKADQKKVDAALIKAVESVPMLKGYLNAKFSLSKNDKPHKMAF
jgi:large subunit ribosomal protein L6e